MSKELRWKILGFGMLVLMTGVSASVLLFFYAFLMKGQWLFFLCGAGLSLAVFIVIKILLLGVDDEANLRYSAALWELFEGAFGWMWLGVAGISIVMLIGALFFGGAWPDLLVCVLVGGLFKWQMSVASTYKAGAAFKRDLIKKGMSREQARDAWIAEIRGKPHPHDSPPSERAE